MDKDLFLEGIVQDLLRHTTDTFIIQWAWTDTGFITRPAPWGGSHRLWCGGATGGLVGRPNGPAASQHEGGHSEVAAWGRVKRD